MALLKTLNYSLTAIQESFKKLENGDLTKEELDDLVNNAKDIYERAIILRYKAYENYIAEKTVVVPATVHEEKIVVPTVEIQHEQEKINLPSQPDLTNEEVKDVVYDLNLFDNAVEATKEEILPEETVEQVTTIATSNELFGVEENHTVLEQITQTPVSEENKAFIEKFSSIDASFFSKLGMSRLETLNNSFGLNEKFQFINELFGGSKETFTEAVQTIDNEHTYQDALITSSVYANKFKWDLKSDTVNDFITKVKRRHV